MGNNQSNVEISNHRNIEDYQPEFFGKETNFETGEKIEYDFNLNSIHNVNMLQRKKKRQSHSKLDDDNIKDKILRKFLNFIVIFINLIIKQTLKDEYDSQKMEIFEFNNDFKKKHSKKQFELLRTNSIYSFLCDENNITSRTKNISNHNKDAFSLIINKNESLKNIFDKPCFEFFSIFYYKTLKFDISKFCINLVIDLSNLRCFYEDVLKKKYIGDEQYFTKMEKSIKKNFLKNYFVIKKSK